MGEHAEENVLDSPVLEHLLVRSRLGLRLQAPWLDEASAMSFLDSHCRVQAMAGYTLLPMSCKDIK